MSLQTFYLGDLNPGNWHEVFVFCLQYADGVTVRFLGENKSNEGFRTFFALPGITVNNVMGDQNGIEISAPLTEEIRDLLYQYQEPAFYGKQPELWDFKLFARGREVLAIEDFTRRLIHLTEEEIGFLLARQVDISDWEAVVMAVAEEEDGGSLEWNEEELQEVARLITLWLASDKKH